MSFIEVFYQKPEEQLSDLPWRIYVKENGRISKDERVSHVRFQVPCWTVYLPQNAGKRGYLACEGRLEIIMGKKCEPCAVIHPLAPPVSA